MSNTAVKLDRLHDSLLAMPEETMLLSQLDGYLTGIILCPETIPASDWLPKVWGPQDEPAGPLFLDSGEARRVTGLIMAHFNTLTAQLEDPNHVVLPVFDHDERPGIEDTLWETWILGFREAVQLRHAAWRAALQDQDLSLTAAMNSIMVLISVGSRRSDLPREEQDKLILLAPTLIPLSMTLLNKWRLRKRQGATKAPVKLHSKLGRNDPCPCGSGKKFKKCCGAA
jgi:uncharacterized protein